MSRKSAKQNRFAQIPAPQYQRSLFKRRFSNKTTLNEGDLIPIHLDEIYAGDTVNVNMSAFLRMTTPITPIMDTIEYDLHAFFIPNRLVMEDYYKMFGSDVPNGSTNFLVPLINTPSGGFTQDSLADYFGIPTKIQFQDDKDKPIALPFRAYNLIWNEWYRDQNLQDKVFEYKGNDYDSILNYNILKRNKRHDYFTSALPFAQKGGEVNLPFGVNNAPVVGNGKTLGLRNSNKDPLTLYTVIQGGANYTLPFEYNENLSNSSNNPATSIFHGRLGVSTDPTKSGLVADLSSVSALTINELRDAVSIQHILERRARGGTRDVEILQNMYGVSPQDSRMQRPELIGVSRSNLNLSTVAQTSESSGSSPLGELSAVGTIQANLKFNYSAVENGFLMVLASARAQNSYQQGLAKFWNKRSFLDIMDPLRANIGEQPVRRKEILIKADSLYNNEVFGYLPNYDDLRFGRNLITGAFRSNHSNSLDLWHLAQEFDPANPPVLSSEFIKQNAPMERILAVKNNPDFYGDVYIKQNHYRVLPVHGIPGLKRL